MILRRPCPRTPRRKITNVKRGAVLCSLRLLAGSSERAPPPRRHPGRGVGGSKREAGFPTLIHAASHYALTVNTTPLPPSRWASTLLQTLCYCRAAQEVRLGLGSAACAPHALEYVCTSYTAFHSISFPTFCMGRPSTHKSSEGPISWPLYVPAPSAAPSTQGQSERITTSSRTPSLNSREDREELAGPWLAENDRRLPSAIVHKHSASRGLGGVVRLPRESLAALVQD